MFQSLVQIPELRFGTGEQACWLYLQCRCNFGQGMKEAFLPSLFEVRDGCARQANETSQTILRERRFSALTGLTNTLSYFLIERFLVTHLPSSPTEAYATQGKCQQGKQFVLQTLKNNDGALH
jgi:hypothetical protein